MKILIGGAWPYANYKLHLGHVAGLIGGDLLARYHRAKGDDVIYVSGSDCHGTPITERAKLEGITPAEISSKYHELFVEAFKGLNFSYDLYTSTETAYHKEKVMEIIKKSYENGAIFEKVEPQAYCEHCGKFMADRELQITCPNCGNITKGDTCECGYTPTDADLIGATCRECGNVTVQKDNKNLYIALSKMQPEIEKYVAENKHFWRTNAQNETEKYLREGLRDRAITRDLNWGIDVPVPGYDNKKLYVWIEAVLGYVTAAMKVCEERGWNFEDFWKNPNPASGEVPTGENDARIYMVHGKDNITFHSIIFPGILLSLHDGYRLPDVIVSSEYLNFNNEKASKSKGNAISALDAIAHLNVDTLRYHLISNGPERKDTNFTISEYVATHNNEVTNKFGNFVNRTLKFKGISELPVGKLDAEVENRIKLAYEEIAKLIETLEFKEAAEKAIRLIDDANKYYDERKPWVQFKEDVPAFNDTIYTCATIIANLSNILEPFMPEAAGKVRSWFGIEKPTWSMIDISTLRENVKLDQVEALFTRFDEKALLSIFEEINQKKEVEKKAKEQITIDYLDKLDLRTAKVLEAEAVEGSDKLLKLKVSLGTETRQIVAGLKKYYAPEEMVGKTVVIVANLKPAKLKGIESQGMVLAAGEGENVKVLTVDGEMNPGEEVR